MTRVLLTSVFKPFGIDDKYGRKESIVEIFHNQLTQYQGIFSIRTRYDSYGIHLIAANIETPTTTLDFPTIERFKRELEKGYDYVGIGGIVPNFQKIKKMAELTREISPKSKIVIGGFCSTVENIDKMIEFDYLCVGEGISFMRDLLGKSPEFKFNHPYILSKSIRLLGAPLFFKNNHPYIVVGLGCSYGCDFCSPSHFFGRKHIEFLKTGKEIFEQAGKLSKKYGSKTFTLIGDDNFLLNEERAMELREESLRAGSPYNFFIFASADRLAALDPQVLAEIGINGVWIGRESKFAPYPKNAGVNIKELVDELRRYGIKTTLSSILLLDHHTKENIVEDVSEHLSCKPVFSQFSFYSPAPNTPLFDRMKQENRLLYGIPFEEMHAFKQPWFIHPNFTPLEAERAQKEAYRREFEELGPGLLRFLDADIEAYQFLKNHANPNMRKRAERIKSDMKFHKPLVAAIGNLVKIPSQKLLAEETLKGLEEIRGRSNWFDQLASFGLTVFGLKEEFMYRYFGDTIQPKTRVTEYNRN